MMNSREEWLLGFSVFLKGTEEEQTEYCFKIYDINSDGFITREEMMTLMKSCLVRWAVSYSQAYSYIYTLYVHFETYKKF